MVKGPGPTPKPTKKAAPNFNTTKGLIPNYSKQRSTTAQTNAQVAAELARRGRVKESRNQAVRAQVPAEYTAAEKRAYGRSRGTLPPKKKGG